VLCNERHDGIGNGRSHVAGNLFLAISFLGVFNGLKIGSALIEKHDVILERTTKLIF
jgi:hypothetical protein